MEYKATRLDERLMRVIRLGWSEGNPYDQPGIYAVVQLGEEQEAYWIFVRHEEEPPKHLIKQDSYVMDGHEPVKF